MFKLDEWISDDYMIGFLLGKALNSKKVKEKDFVSSIEVDEEDVRRVDAILTSEMDQEVLHRLRKQDYDS